MKKNLFCEGTYVFCSTVCILLCFTDRVAQKPASFTDDLLFD